MDFIIENGALIGVSNIGGKKDILIPANVTTISNSVFDKCYDIRSVVIPHGVKRIEAGAFSNCPNLEKIYFPSTIEYINESAFESTAWLNNYPSDFVVIGNILYKYKGKSNDITIPDNVKVINSHAFYEDENILNITISDSVRIIQSFAFYECRKLESIVIPESVKEIGSYIFCECRKLQYVYIMGRYTPRALFETSNINDHSIEYTPTSNPQNVYAPHICIRDCQTEHTRLMFTIGFAISYLQNKYFDENVITANKEYIVTNKERLTEISDSYKYLFAYMIIEDLIYVADIISVLEKTDELWLKTILLDHYNQTHKHKSISDMYDEEYNLDDN